MNNWFVQDYNVTMIIIKDVRMFPTMNLIVRMNNPISKNSNDNFVDEPIRFLNLNLALFQQTAI